MAIPTMGRGDEAVSQTEDALLLLAVAFRNVTYYGLEHPAVRNASTTCCDLLQSALGSRDQLVLKVVEGDVLFEDVTLFDRKTAPADLIRACEERGVQCMVLRQKVSADDLLGLVHVLLVPVGELTQQGGAQARLAAAGVTQVVLESLEYGAAQPKARAEMPSEEKLTQVGVRELYGRALAVAKAIASFREQGEEVDVQEVGGLARDMVAGVLSNRGALEGMATVRSFDQYTFVHSVNLSILALVTAQALEMSPDEMQELGICALLHDVGKAYIPLDILRKPGKLSAQEWEVMQRHPALGARVLAGRNDVPDFAAVVAMEHHMGYDLSGYPKPSTSRRPCLFSLVVAVGDCYDALTTLRPYRRPLRPDEAVEVMAGQPEVFEPRLARVFQTALGAFPVGTFVRLNTNELGVVSRAAGEDLRRPWVGLVFDGSGTRLPHAEEVDLMERTNGRFRRSIVRSLDPAPKRVVPSEVLESLRPE